jgi:ligand-binding SRPBCC domain-containing protein
MSPRPGRPGPNDFALERTQVVPRTPDETFAFFADPWNLEAITPPWLRFRILAAPPRLERGSTLRYRLSLFGLTIVWHTVISDWRAPRTFTDAQTLGPYPLWVHTHRFTPVGSGTEIYDHVRYRAPGGPLSVPIRRYAVRGWLDEIFDFRSRTLSRLLESA